MNMQARVIPVIRCPWKFVASLLSSLSMKYCHLCDSIHVIAFAKLNRDNFNEIILWLTESNDVPGEYITWQV